MLVLQKVITVDVHTVEEWVAARGGFCELLDPGGRQMDSRNSCEGEWVLEAAGFGSDPDHWPKSPSFRVEFKT